jgi:Peptidase_C39 like family
MSEPRDLTGFRIHRQPDDTTCGPTCLHAVYEHFGEDVPLDELLPQVPTLEGGGTLGVLLATHAVRRGYRVKLITWNLQVFDPTWFEPEAPPVREKLLARGAAKADPKMTVATQAYVDFLDAGGRIEFRDLEPALLRKYLKRGVPILTGLSATFLYGNARERGHDNESDDIAGDPVGHFVVLTGYQPDSREVLVTDPMYPNPLATEHTYPVRMQRVIGSIYLGVLTYDANLIIIEPHSGSRNS